ncbi:MAG: SOS response-associated peptidase [Clostridiales bacterium]|jgi:putative SOS response-associated peptidase YedK|nr:SOS response-associated peptidase [Clostridiales bacterium]
MCGRFEFADDRDIEEVESIIRQAQKNTDSVRAFKTGEIYPTNRVPIIARSSDGAYVGVMRWGFSIGGKPVINARSETASAKRMFASPMKTGRCVVPSTGFYEWTHIDGKPKDKLHFIEPNQKMLYMAALAAKYRVKGSEILEDCFVILTREANLFMSEIHNRMPVILHKNEIAKWLADEAFSERLLLRDSIELERKPAS